MGKKGVHNTDDNQDKFEKQCQKYSLQQQSSELLNKTFVANAFKLTTVCDERFYEFIIKKHSWQTEKRSSRMVLHLNFC